MKLKVKQIQSLIDKTKKDLKFNDKELYSLSDITEILNLTMEQIDNLENILQCLLVNNLFLWNNLKIDINEIGYIEVAKFNWHN